MLNRNDVVLANRISQHALCDVGLVGNTGIPTHILVAAVFHFAEYEQIVTTFVQMRKIDLMLKDPKPEAEQLTADRVVAHILSSRTSFGLAQCTNETCIGSGNRGARVQKLTCTGD